jgi:hypothetical protein
VTTVDSRRLPPLALYAAGALVLLALYAGLALWFTGGRLSLPLDDAFIYMQYARQTAAGHPFQYNTGDLPTSGCTSPLYVLLLVPAFWVGLDGVALIPWVLLLGAAALAGTAWCMHRLAARWLGDPWGGWAGSLTLLCGPLVWGALSGMEIALFALLLLWLLERADRVLRHEATWTSLLWPASATALVRPEGWIAVAAAAAVLAAGRGGTPSEDDALDLPFDQAPPPARSPDWRGLALGLGVPLVLGLLPGLAFWLSGTSFTPNGVSAKSLLASRPLELPLVAREVLSEAIEILKGIFGGSLGDRTSAKLFAYDMNARAVFFAPLTFALFALGLAPAVAAEWRRRRPGRATLVASWFGLLLLATASIVEADAHFNRYQMPIMPLFLLGALAGVVRVGRWVRPGGGSLARGLAGFLALFGAASTCVFAVHYGDNAADIERLQMTMARVIDERLPRDAGIAINDAGVLRYLGGRRTLDLVGLTSPGLAPRWRAGSGSLIELFENLSPASRPTHFAIFPNWFKLEDSALLRPLHSVRLHTASIVDREKVLYAADWEAIRSDDAPCDATAVPVGHRIVDRLDLADLDEEARHRFRTWQRERGLQLYTPAIRAACASDPQRPFVEGGRLLNGGASMQVTVEPGRQAVVLVRVPGGARLRVLPRWDGSELAPAELSGPANQWVEQVVALIPAARVTRPRAELVLEADTRDGADRPLVLCHVWIAQPL